MSGPVVQCVDATKRFDEVVAIDRVSFVLAPGEILSVLGPSGCGKTTLLRTIAGFETLERGEIRIQERLVSSPAVHVPPERRQVGMVFQDYSLFSHLTVVQNVRFGLGRLSRQDRQHRVAEVLDLARLTGLEDRYSHELSGGQQQRVALARTLAPRPVTVLLDEPFSNVDAAMRAEMRLEVEQILRENQVTTVLVTHNREEAFAIADRIAVMRDGALDQIDTPEALFNAPSTRFVARMTGISDFLPGRAGSDGRVFTELGDLPYRAGDSEIAAGSAIDLLVHADDFQVLVDPYGRSAVAAREFRGDEVLLAVRVPSGDTIRCRQHHGSTLPTGTNVTLVPTRVEPFLAFVREVSSDE